MSMLRLLQTNLVLTCLILALLLILGGLIFWAVSRSNKAKTEMQTSTLNEKEEELRANVVNAFLLVSLQTNQNQLEQALNHSLSLYLMADFLGLLRYDPIEERLSLNNAYDLIREDHNHSILLQTEKLPVLLQKFTNGEVLVSNDNAELKSEKNYLMEAIGYNQLGKLMLFPLKASFNQPDWAILALSPYTNKAWLPSDLQKLERLQANLRRVLDGANQLEQEALRIDKLQNLLAETEKDADDLRLAYAVSKTQAEELSQGLQETQIAWKDEVSNWIEKQKTVEAEVEELRKTMLDKEADFAELEALRLEKIDLKEKLNLKSEQTSQLKNTIDQASQLLLKLTDQTTKLDEERP